MGADDSRSVEKQDEAACSSEWNWASWIAAIVGLQVA